MTSRIMYIQVAGGLGGCDGRIGRVTFSKTMKSLYYQGMTLQTLGGRGYKANFVNGASGVRYWVSGPKKNGQDPLYQGWVVIDDDVNREYWETIRGLPDMVGTTRYRSLGKYAKSGRRDKRPKGILSPHRDD